jgi:23S rRNA (cytidine1920-2'-O)/16S rRNA (cytidine1409-2'-O)-methyltransferase
MGKKNAARAGHAAAGAGAAGPIDAARPPKPAKPLRRRLDDELVAQGFFADRACAMRAVLAGEVSGGGERLDRPGMSVKAGTPLHVRTSPRTSARGLGTYVSRGGLKLEGALAAFGIDPAGMACLDVGCSTGGFTDCLLKLGAARVSAVDVGYGQFDWGLRGDGRVSLFERTNICDADPQLLGAPFDLAVADVSFTSVGTVLGAIERALGEKGALCTLVKPQFEAARDEVGEGGVVRDPAVHARVLRDVVDVVSRSTLSVCGLAVSPVHGAKGNIEYFLLARRGAASVAPDVDACVRQAWGGSL